MKIEGRDKGREEGERRGQESFLIVRKFQLRSCEVAVAQLNYFAAHERPCLVSERPAI